MSVLIIAEHHHGILKQATLHAVTAGLALSNQVDVLVAGEGIADVVASCRSIAGVSKVWVAEHACYEHQLPEAMSLLIKDVGDSYSHILAASTSFGKNLMPRIAAMLDVGQISDVVSVLDESRFQRYIYAGNVLADVASMDHKKIMTIRLTAFDRAAQTNGSCSIERLCVVHAQSASEFIEKIETVSDLPSLNDAEIVISGGRGLQDKASFDRLSALAKRMHAAIGASRAAVDAGMAPNDWQVGQTGQIVAPKLYIAVAISGAIQHVAGMKDSQVVVAINEDPNAPIFEYADYGLVADIFSILPEWERWLDANVATN
jgi:electron transfer flavoprotein alpha subunit